MSKIPQEKFKSCIATILAGRKTDATKPAKVRGFVETIDLQIGLKDYDPNKDK